MNQLSHLKDKILNKKKDYGLLTDLVELAKELGCLPDIIGRDYEVRDDKGKIIYTIRQKAMSINQLNTLMNQLQLVHKRENERMKKGNKGKSRKR